MSGPNQLLILGVSGPELTSAEANLFRELQPGGFILFTRNVVSAEQTRKLTDDLRDLSEIEPFLCIDNEGGRVWRTSEFAPAPPSADQLRRAGDQKLAAIHGWATGRLLRLLGLNLNLAPVLDIDHHPGAANALRGRCWGHTDQEVIDLAGNFNRFQRRQGVLGCGKHFPAGGLAVSDPHHDLPVVDASADELQRSEILPYTALMPELDAVMVSHLHFPRFDDDQRPASLSKNVIANFLRGRLGFDRHLVLTDDLDMGAIQQGYGTPVAARMAVEAGSDTVLLCHEFMTARDTLHELESLSNTQVDDALRRIERAKKRFYRPTPFDPAKLDELYEAIADLHEQVPADGTGESDPSQSPVEDY